MTLSVTEPRLHRRRPLQIRHRSTGLCRLFAASAAEKPESGRGCTDRTCRAATSPRVYAIDRRGHRGTFSRGQIPCCMASFGRFRYSHSDQLTLGRAGGEIGVLLSPFRT